MRALPASAVLLAVGLWACPAPTPVPDAGPTDAGAPDAGPPDAGPPRPDAGPPDAGFTRVAAEEWCATKALAECVRDVRCGRLSADRLDDCRVRKAEPCDQPAYTSAVAGGRLQYLATEAAKCLNAYWQGSCEEVPPSCTGVAVGLVPPDGGCILPAECTSAGFCYQYDNLCPHRCRPWEPLGGRCDGFTMQCDPANATCDVGDGGVEVCQAPKNEGDACLTWDSCRSDLACISSRCVRRVAGPGETCGETSSYPLCQREYFCRQEASGTGTPPPGTCQRRAGLGGTCPGAGGCLPSLRCSTVLTTGTCVPKARVGEACANYDDCEDGLYCDGRTQRCTAMPADGGDCSSLGSFYRCATGYYCEFDPLGDDDRCRGKKTLGQDCTYDGVCLSNECEFGTLPDGGFGGRCIVSCSQRADGGF